ncbi:hypothetical protein [Quatrionicoccus australiensis]|uniref:hypothetical protein n=1 Tax=Quatrionicoccus australiensis TaxID=138118 RepID=UPI001CFB1D1A|nr:hypothetical protein [Quatrionicoccus australiensis]MCB4358391.1 hypothetical protein [Quatrionicoccus australiensis]
MSLSLDEFRKQLQEVLLAAQEQDRQAGPRLRWLLLGAIHVAAGCLRPLGKLKALRWIGLGNFFDVSEFAWLAAALPDVMSDWTKPCPDLGHLGIRCKKCRTHAMPQNLSIQN